MIVHCLPKTSTWYILLAYKIWRFSLQPFQRYDCGTKLKILCCDPDHAPFRGGLLSIS